MGFINFNFKNINIDHKKYFLIFENIYNIEPRLFYWINLFPSKKDRYILTQFRHQNFLKYTGLELVIIDQHRMTYHRLPGAKPNGNGFVKTGKHCIQLNSMDEADINYFCVEKLNLLDLNCKHTTIAHDLKNKFIFLPCRKLNYQLFIPELIEIIMYGLEFHYQNSLINQNFNYLDKLNELIENIFKSDLDFRIIAICKRIQMTLFDFGTVKKIENKSINYTV
ncbi:hypothetical protein [Fluviispira multicolorata]|uniref:Uncharacterized protein n=1 Tax=Fluviispira multicolorata TaxID=2654512 RepID=A0A833N087_9BACT|nr:hypothetical protein [Fluviispira multicolorata]KAB8028088.1 hypothetical protein GCL57_13640 [Fluviispira multicolorata]